MTLSLVFRENASTLLSHSPAKLMCNCLFWKVTWVNTSQHKMFHLKAELSRAVCSDTSLAQTQAQLKPAQVSGRDCKTRKVGKAQPTQSQNTLHSLKTMMRGPGPNALAGRAGQVSRAWCCTATSRSSASSAQGRALSLPTCSASHGRALPCSVRAPGVASARQLLLGEEAVTWVSGGQPVPLLGIAP